MIAHHVLYLTIFHRTVKITLIYFYNVKTVSESLEVLQDIIYAFLLYYE
jgi:hypothetical protein